MSRIAPQIELAFALTLAALGLWPGQARVASETQDLRQTLESLPEDAYVGGMSPQVRALAERARARVRKEQGSELPACPDPEQGMGFVVATGIGVEAKAPSPTTSATLGELRQLLHHERRSVRESAAFIVGEIGPAAKPLEADLSGGQIDRSPWFSHALGRMDCSRFAIVSVPVAFFPSAARARLMGTKPRAPTVGFKMELVAKLLDDKTLRWPDHFFSSIVDSTVARNAIGELDEVKADSVLAIAKRASEHSAPQALRLDLVEMLERLGKAAKPAAKTLWPLAQDSDNDLALAAALAVLSSGDELALKAAELLLKRFEMPLSTLPDELCTAAGAVAKLGPIARKRMSGDNWSEAKFAAQWLGCLDPVGNAAFLRRQLKHVSWETQIAVIAALASSAKTDLQTKAALREVRNTHWSGLVRLKASEALEPPPPSKENSEDKLVICFSQCPTDHLRQCGDDQGVVDGLYVSPSMGELQVEWQRAHRAPVPRGFPMTLDEGDRPDYGTTTFLRIEDGWLFGIDRWHYDGMTAFVDDRGHATNLGQWGEQAVAFVDTSHFGRVLLGSSLFEAGDAGVLSTVERDGNSWRIKPRVALPSPPWGWAFAPNGTLLVADPYEAVAVLKDGSIESLACPTRAPAKVPANLLAMASAAPRALGESAQRAADDAIEVYASTVARLRSRLRQAEQTTSALESWEKPEIVQGRLKDAVNGWLNVALQAGRADQALEALALTQDDPSVIDADQRFEVYASAGQTELARAQLSDDSGKNNRTVLRYRIMLALAESREADAQEAFNQLAILTRDEQPAQDDIYLDLLKGLITKEWPKPDTKAEAPTAWPSPIREFLAGRSTESALVLASHTRDGRVDREKLCEALFYVGVKFALEDNSRLAREYFEAVVDLGVQHYQEDAVAMVVLGNRER